MANENKVVFSLDLDGTTIKHDLEEIARNEIKEEAKKQLRNTMFRKSYYSYSDIMGDPQEWVKDLIKEILAEDKDTIVKLAAHELAESMRRSKKVREKYGELLDEEFNKADDEG